MKKGTVWTITIVAIVAILVIWVVKGYNGLVTAEETVTTEWANVESQYQRQCRPYSQFGKYGKRLCSSRARDA